MAFCENCGNALNPTAKFCGGCGNQVETTSQDTNQHSVDETPPPKHGYQRAPGNDMGITTSRPAGRIWYLLPLLGGLFGGIIAWAIIKNRNPKRARNILILGIVFGIIQYGLIGIVVIITLVSSAIDSPDEMSEIDSILSQYPEQIQKIKRSQLVDCEFNMAYLQSEAAGDIYKERCIDAILGR